MIRKSLAEIAKLLGLPPPAGDATLTGLASLSDATGTEISYVSSAAYEEQYLSTRAAAVIAATELNLPPRPNCVLLRVSDSDLAVAQVMDLFATPPPRPPPGVDPLARVAASAQLAPGVAVGPFCHIGENSRIAAGCVIHPGVFISADVVLGANCEIFSNVAIHHRVKLGSGVVIHSGAVIGSDGFGYRWDGKRHAKIPHLGTVIIEDDVEIGSCVCIDRAKLGETRIGCGTRIDNLVHVGHNVHIGPHCILVAQTGLGGSSRLGAGVIMGGQSATVDHVVIGDRAKVAARGAVVKDVEPGGEVSGVPAHSRRQHFRELHAITRLPDLLHQVRKLEEQVAQLLGQKGK